jgi:hypothetical protein
MNWIAPLCMCSNLAVNQAHTKFQQIEAHQLRSEFCFAQTNSNITSELGLLEKGTCLSEAFSDQIKAPKAPKERFIK